MRRIATISRNGIKGVKNKKLEVRSSKQIQIDERQTHRMFQTGRDEIRGLENLNSSGFTFV